MVHSFTRTHARIRRLTFFGHLARMHENADASRAIFGPPPENWRRPPGRPRTTWMKNIHDDLSSLDLGIHEARDLVENRPLWRLMSLHSDMHLYWCMLLHTHTRLTALCPGLPGWAATRKVKPVWILLKQKTVGGSGISWAICKSAPRSRQTTTPAPHHSYVFTGRMPFLPPNQQRQSTEGTWTWCMLLLDWKVLLPTCPCWWQPAHSD